MDPISTEATAQTLLAIGLFVSVISYPTHEGDIVDCEDQDHFPIAFLYMRHSNSWFDSIDSLIHNEVV